MTEGPTARSGGIGATPSVTAGPPALYRARLSPRTIPRVLWAIVAGLLIAHLGLQWLHHSRVDLPLDLHLIFNVDDEPTVPTWYSSMSLLFAAGLLYLIADQRRRARDRDAARWLGLAVGFTLMSLDEIAAFHEAFNTFSNVEWTIPGSILVVLIGAFYVPFLWRLPASTRNRFLIAGLVYVGGAVVVEHLSGPEYFPFDVDTMQYAAATAVEEGLEMAGVVLFVAALLRVMAAESGESVAVDVAVAPSVGRP